MIDSRSPLTAASATFTLKAGVWFRRGRLFMVSPVHDNYRRLQVFEKLGKEPSGTDCPAIDGLIKEAEETACEIEDKSVLDATIVANVQAVEHYEISRYGTLIAWAEELGHDDIVRFLTTNANEEKAANTKLNTVVLRKGSIGWQRADILAALSKKSTTGLFGASPSMPFRRRTQVDRLEDECNGDI